MMSQHQKSTKDKTQSKEAIMISSALMQNEEEDIVEI